MSNSFSVTHASPAGMLLATRFKNVNFYSLFIFLDCIISICWFSFTVRLWLGVYAHIAERDWECNNNIRDDNCDDNAIDDIAEQLVHGPVGKHLKVIFGGGRFNFINATEKDEQGKFGKRTDGKNLIKEWLNNKKDNEVRSYVWNKVSFTC